MYAGSNCTGQHISKEIGNSPSRVSRHAACTPRTQACLEGFVQCQSSVAVYFRTGKYIRESKSSNVAKSPTSSSSSMVARSSGETSSGRFSGMKDNRPFRPYIPQSSIIIFKQLSIQLHMFESCGGRDGFSELREDRDFV